MYVNRLQTSVAHVIAALIAANGCRALSAGLAEFFHFDFCLELEFDEVSHYLQTAPTPSLGGFVSMALRGERWSVWARDWPNAEDFPGGGP